MGFKSDVRIVLRRHQSMLRVISNMFLLAVLESGIIGSAMPTLQWHHNGRDSVSNHQHHDCLLNRSFRRRTKKTSKLRVTCLCAGNSPVTGEFPAQMASNAEKVSIWWRHHAPFSRYEVVTKNKIAPDAIIDNFSSVINYCLITFTLKKNTDQILNSQ